MENDDLLELEVKSRIPSFTNRKRAFSRTRCKDDKILFGIESDVYIVGVKGSNPSGAGVKIVSQ